MVHYDIGNIKVEEDVDVIEESFIAINKEADIGIKQEEIPEDINVPGIKPEPEEVSYVCICLLLDTFYQCPEMYFFFRCHYFWPIETAPLLGMNNFCCHAAHDSVFAKIEQLQMPHTAVCLAVKLS